MSAHPLPNLFPRLAHIARRTARAILLPVILASSAFAADLTMPGEEVAPARSTKDTVAELTQLLQNGRLSPGQMRTIMEALEQLKANEILDNKDEAVKEQANSLQRAIVQDLRAAPNNRLNLLSAAKFFLYQEAPETALGLLRNAQPASEMDLDWPLLMSYTYLRLGDLHKSSLFLDHVDRIMQERAPLRMEPPVLAERVTAYRVYTPRGNAPLKPGDVLTLYVEVHGVSFQSSGTSQVRCKLQFGLQLRDAMQNVLFSEDEFGIYDPTYQGPIRDMHAVIFYRIPNDLTPGRYCLILTCTDLLNPGTDATCQNDTCFDIGSSRPRLPDPEPTPKTPEQIKQLDPLSDLDEFMDTPELEDTTSPFPDIKPGDSPEETKRKALEMRYRRSQRQTEDF